MKLIFTRMKPSKPEAGPVQFWGFESAKAFGCPARKFDAKVQRRVVNPGNRQTNKNVSMRRAFPPVSGLNYGNLGQRFA